MCWKIHSLEHWTSRLLKIARDKVSITAKNFGLIQSEIKKNSAVDTRLGKVRHQNRVILVQYFLFNRTRNFFYNKLISQNDTNHTQTCPVSLAPHYRICFWISNLSTCRYQTYLQKFHEFHPVIFCEAIVPSSSSLNRFLGETLHVIFRVSTTVLCQWIIKTVLTAHHHCAHGDFFTVGIIFDDPACNQKQLCHLCLLLHWHVFISFIPCNLCRWHIGSYKTNSCGFGHIIIVKYCALLGNILATLWRHIQHDDDVELATSNRALNYEFNQCSMFDNYASCIFHLLSTSWLYQTQ